MRLGRKKGGVLATQLVRGIKKPGAVAGLESNFIQDVSEQLHGAPDIVLRISVPVRNGDQFSFVLLHENVRICHFIPAALSGYAGDSCR